MNGNGLGSGSRVGWGTPVSSIDRADAALLGNFRLRVEELGAAGSIELECSAVKLGDEPKVQGCASMRPSAELYLESCGGEW